MCLVCVYIIHICVCVCVVRCREVWQPGRALPGSACLCQEAEQDAGRPSLEELCPSSLMCARVLISAGFSP